MLNITVVDLPLMKSSVLVSQFLHCIYKKGLTSYN